MALASSENSDWDHWGKACGFTSWQAAAKSVGLTLGAVWLARNKPTIRLQTRLAMSAVAAKLAPYEASQAGLARAADDRILWGIVANAGRLSDRRKVRWAHVSDATGQGSNASAELCRRFGFNPDEERGGEVGDHG
jgi:hypothetical protein